MLISTGASQVVGVMGICTTRSSGDCGELEGAIPSKEGGCYSAPADSGQCGVIFTLFYFEEENINVGF